MDNNKLAAIFNVVVDLTDSKKIVWKKIDTNVLGNDYTTILDHFEFRIVDMLFNYTFKIYQNDKEIGVIRDNDPQFAGKLKCNPSNLASLIARILDNRDENLDDLMNRLNKLK
jgi:hypothetical protein